MDSQPATAYCQKCQDIQPVLQLPDSLPRCQVCGLPVGTSLSMQDPKLGKATKVLIVDDDPLIVQMYRDLLEHNDFMVISASDGTRGLEVAARERPDVLLLDIMMPGIDGFEVCRRMKTDLALKSIPVIILTAMADPKLNVQAFKAGANLALRKPAEPATILRTLQAALALAATRKV